MSINNKDFIICMALINALFSSGINADKLFDKEKTEILFQYAEKHPEVNGLPPEVINILIDEVNSYLEKFNSESDDFDEEYI